MRLPVRLITVLVVGGLGLAAWFGLGLGGHKVTLASPTRGPAADLVYATGYVEAEDPVSVSAQITAPVKSVLVAEGDAVRAGQPLVVLDEGETRGLLGQAEAQARLRDRHRLVLGRRRRGRGGRRHRRRASEQERRRGEGVLCPPG